MFHMTFPYGEACDSEQYSILKVHNTYTSIELFLERQRRELKK